MISVPYTLHTFGAKPHQTGWATNNSRTARVYMEDSTEHRDGPCVVLVRDGKPLCERGRELLRRAN